MFLENGPFIGDYTGKCTIQIDDFPSYKPPVVINILAGGIPTPVKNMKVGWNCEVPS